VGGVLGYTLEDSMSGCVAFRRHLHGFRGSREPLYRKALGGPANARNIIDALAAGTIDVGPLDSYYHDLLRKNDPEFAARVRVIATTAPAPIPPLIATARLAPAFVVPREADYDLFDGILAVSREYEGIW
jgi:hypothetical protein